MEESIYFNPGQIVTLKQDIPNKPKMVVVKKETSLFKHDTKKVGKYPILDADGSQLRGNYRRLYLIQKI